MQKDAVNKLKSYLLNQSQLEFAVLVGSRATGKANQNSDWDIAIQWRRSELDYMGYLARMEITRKAIGDILGISCDKIDLIDVPSAKLAMRDLIANHGLVLAGEENLSWLHFLTRTWRDLEDYYWDETYVA